MIVEDRPYQNRAVDALVPCRGGIAKVPAGGGKTIIGAKALNRWARLRARLKRRRMVAKVVANTTDQVDQWKSAMALFPEIADACDISLHCYQGAPKLDGADIALFDECHHIAAPEFAKIADGAQCVKWGFSATPERADDLANEVYRLIGPIVCTVDRQELLQAGKLAHARVYIHEPNAKDEHVEAVAELAESHAQKWMFGAKEAAFRMIEQTIGFLASHRSVPGIAWVTQTANAYGVSTNAPVMALSRKMSDKPDEKRRLWDFCKAAARDEIESRARWVAAQEIGIFQNTKRDDLIVRLFERHAGDTVLCLIGKIEHGQQLAERIPGAMVIHSQMRKSECGMTRKTAIEAFKDGRLNMVFATSLADEGLDVPRANVLILGAAGRSAAKAEQRTARVLRAFHDKSHGTIHDFMDTQHPFLAAQSKARIRLYRQLGYEVVFTKEGLL